MNKILNLILPVFLLVIGVQFIRDYFGNTAGDREGDLEQLIANGQETMGTLSDEYTEKTVKIAKIPVKTYEVAYSFKVGKESYTGNKSLMAPPTMPLVAVTYLPNDPAVNAIDPADELSNLTKSEGDTTTLLIGLGLFLAGAGLGFYRWKSMQGANPA